MYKRQGYSLSSFGEIDLQFPLSFGDISLVLGVVALVLLITYELASSYHERNLALEKKVLKSTALMFGFAFLFTVVVKIYQIVSLA